MEPINVLYGIYNLLFWAYSQVKNDILFDCAAAILVL